MMPVLCQMRFSHTNQPRRTTARIPTRQEIYDALCDSASAPLRFERILKLFGLKSPASRHALLNRLNAMLRSGEITCADARYGPAPDCHSQSIEGIVTRKDGKLFLRSDAEDIPLPQRLARRLFVNDKIRLRLVGADKASLRPVAAEVSERSHEIIGVFRARDSVVVSLQDDTPIRVDKKAAQGIADGATVAAKLSPPTFLGEELAAASVAVRKQTNIAALEIDLAIRNFGLPERWPDAALRESETIADKVRRKPSKVRRDLRDKCFVTIDGEDAKDFDDAILVEHTDGKTYLSVAIADVASYVAPGSALDKEAYLRGNSIYFPGKVIPMLPPMLSDGLCSLRPGEDRLAMVCAMCLSSDGELGDYRIFPAVIRSHARLTYGNVAAFLARKGALRDAPRGVATMLRNAYKLWQVLHRARRRRGALDLDVPSAYVAFDAQGGFRSAEPLVRNDAHRMIEEFMICANVAAARFLSQHKAAYLRRVHQGLKEDGLDSLNDFLRDLKLRAKDETPSDIAALLNEAETHQHKQLIHLVILRLLARAVYAPLDSGHFGLALEKYAHFTSPIRRYPDLLAHRAIHAALGLPAGQKHGDKSLTDIGIHCSETEKRADDATRDIDRCFKCHLLQKHVGSVFNACAQGITDFGMFMEIEGMYVDGLLHISKLGDDYYHYDSRSQSLRGERNGAVYRLGSRMKVRIVRVDPAKREVDIVPANQSARRGRKR